MKKGTKNLIIIIVIILTMYFLQGCVCEADKSIPMNDNENIVESENPVVKYLDSEKKHGIVEFSSKKYDTDYGKVQKFEYWFDKDLYRITWFNEDGTIRLHMISPDGKTMYHSDPIKMQSTPSYNGPDFHQLIFNGPEGFEPRDGIDENGYIVYEHIAKIFWDYEEASQQFYLEDLKYYSKDGKLVQIDVRTNSKKVEEDELVTSKYVIVLEENDIDFPDDIFDLPYDIVKE